MALLGGLLAFTLGFAVAGVVVLTHVGGGVAYLVGICLGLVGIGLVGFFYHRGTAALPDARLWSPLLVRALTGPLSLPALPVLVTLYALGVVGLLGNLVIPMARRH